MNSIPDEIRAVIFAKLSISDWCNLNMCCKLFRETLTNDMFKQLTSSEHEMVNAINISKTPDQKMSIAAKYGNLSLVEHFITLGAEDYISAMVYADIGGSSDLVEYFNDKIIEKEKNSPGGIDIRYTLRNSRRWDYALIEVAKRGHLDAVKHLIEKGATNITLAIFRTAAGGHLELVKYLAGTNVEYWESAMRGAAHGNHLHIVEYSMVYGASNLNRAMTSAALGGHLALVEYFIGKGAHDFQSALESAAYGGHLDMVQYLSDMYDMGIDDYNEALGEAACGGNKDIVDYLISKGANDFDCAMSCAADEEHFELVKYLIDLGATEYRGEYYNNVEIINYFVEKGIRHIKN